MGRIRRRATTIASVLALASLGGGCEGGVDDADLVLEDELEDGDDWRIWNGQDASQGEYPYMASLHHFGDGGLGPAQCGGALIRKRWVVTAAHCVTGLENQVQSFGGHIRIGVGRIQQSKYNGGNTTRAVEAYLHPNYNPFTGINDVAVIKLKDAINKPLGKLAATGPHNELEDAGEKVWALGFGMAKQLGSGAITLQTDRLQEAALTIIGTASCDSLVNGSGGTVINGRVVCAKGLGQSVDNVKMSCSGDSGSPLVHKNGGNPRIVGITARSTCQYLGNDTVGLNPALPSTYTKARKVRNWVLQCSGQGSCDGPNWL